MARPRVFFDIAIGANPAGRVVFELYSDVTPKTAECVCRVRPLPRPPHTHSHTACPPAQQELPRAVHGGEGHWQDGQATAL